MTAVSLGVPEMPVRPLAERRLSRQIQVGPVAVGAALLVAGVALIRLH